MFENLRQELEKKRFKQHHVAAILGCTTQTVNAKINGRAPFLLDEAIELKKALNTRKSIESLFEK